MKAISTFFEKHASAPVIESEHRITKIWFGLMSASLVAAIVLFAVAPGIGTHLDLIPVVLDPYPNLEIDIAVLAHANPDAAQFFSSVMRPVSKLFMILMFATGLGQILSSMLFGKDRDHGVKISNYINLLVISGILFSLVFSVFLAPSFVLPLESAFSDKWTDGTASLRFVPLNQLSVIVLGAVFLVCGAFLLIAANCLGRIIRRSLTSLFQVKRAG